ncbi:MAG: RNA polymerase sigma factor [Myxococcales bacterium]|nr:RNA polymerase sigma factor [Myxococcales bacterium]
MKATDPEEQLLRRFVDGDPLAAEALYRRFEREAHGWILRIVRDPAAAEDVLVESFWRAYRARARFVVTRPFGAWLRRIATRAALDHLRAARRRTERRLGEVDPQAPAAGDLAARDAIARAFRRLPAKLQVVATLALVEERPYREIAEALDLPLGTVKSRLSRASARLREDLSRQGIRP